MIKVRCSIKTILRTDNMRRDGKASIDYRVILNGVMIKLPSGKFIEPIYWDKVHFTVGKNHPLCKELNTLLSIRMDEFNKFLIKQEILDKEINKEVVKDFFSGRVHMSFYEFWEQQLKSWKSVKREGTLKCYRSTLNSLKEFRSTVYFNDLNLQFVEDLNNYLKGTRKNSDGGAASTHKWTKCMVKAAIKKGYIEKNPYDDFKVKQSDYEREFLTIEEVKKLMDVELIGKNQSLDKVRDIFIFACYTGLRYSDIEGLKWENVEENSIKVKMMKTDRYITVPLISQSKIILNKYKPLTAETLSDKVFHTITNQKTNTALKRLMKVAKITKSISFHCARHTFACIHVNAGTHMLNLKSLLGHSSIQQTEIYAKSQDKDLVTAMNNLSRM